MGWQPKRGFLEYVKNPRLFWVETRQGTGPARPPTPREIARLVAAIGERRLERHELQRLVHVREQAAPLLLAALRDERFLFHRYGTSVLDGSAIQTALDLVEPMALPEAAVLAPALKHTDDFFRARALYHLGRCGNDDAIGPLIDGLRSPSSCCRTWVLLGLEFLHDSPRGSYRFRQAVFEAILPLLDDPDRDPAERAPSALLALDPTRGRAVLLGDMVFSPEGPWIHDVLKALDSHGVAVPGPRLRALLASLKPRASGFPLDRAYARALVLLARAEGPGANDLITDAQGWGNEEVRAGAGEAAKLAAGVVNAYRFVIDLYEQKGPKGLTHSQLDYLTLTWLDAEVRNGGFTQYYFNSSGELAMYAVQAARAVGAPRSAGIIQKANALFGVNGPTANREKRMSQLSDIDVKALDDLATEYYKSGEKMGEILDRYVAAHASDFKPSE